MKLRLRINGKAMEMETRADMRLLDILRSMEDDEGTALKGTKEGCGEGECGACSVFLNGKLVNSCLIPAPQAQDAHIETIEGIGATEAGKLLIQSLTDAHGVQCGFCTPGFVMAAINLLRVESDPDEQAIRTALAGNLCRCTGYDMIVDGVQLAAKAAAGKEGFTW
jgi:carbon-monoxide dehydrogenase small subunit